LPTKTSKIEDVAAYHLIHSVVFSLSSHRSATYGYQPYNRLTSSQNASSSFDANGNLQSLTATGGGQESFGWDYESRMISAFDGWTNVAYGYDALGRRISRTDSSGATKFIYDGQDIVLDENPGTSSGDGGGTDLPSGGDSDLPPESSSLTKYLNGPGIDNKLRQTRPYSTGCTNSIPPQCNTEFATEYFLQDHLGSTNGLTDTSGSLTSTGSYDSFGNPTSVANSRYGFTGRESGDVAGLMYYRARWYDPDLGRFMSEDPISFRGGDINLYGYVKNNPINFTDPTGLQAPYEEIKMLDAVYNLAENLLCQDIAPDFLQGNVSFFGFGGTATLTRDGDVLVGYEGDFAGFMKNFFVDLPVAVVTKTGFPSLNATLSSQKILRFGRLTRKRRLAIVGGTSFSGGLAYNIGVAGQYNPTKEENNYSIGPALGRGFNLSLGGGQSFHPTILGEPLQLPIRWGAPSPEKEGDCGCEK
jgi:RHS repeat-associated protein